MPDENDDRSIVDVALRKRRRRIRLARVDDLDRGGPVERDRLTGSRDGDGRRRVYRIGQEAVICRVRVCDAGVHDDSHVETIQNLHQPSDVVLVRVAEDQDVDPSREEGKVRAQATQGQLRIRSSVDQHGGSAGRFEKNRVALAGVEHCHVQQAVRTRRDRDREKHRDEAGGDGCRAHHATDGSRQGTRLIRDRRAVFDRDRFAGRPAD